MYADDLSAFLMLTGDIAFLAGLVLMALLSATAGTHIPAGTRVPMQWGWKGRTLWRLRRRWALLWAPAWAAVAGLVLTAGAHWHGVPASQAAVSLAVLRTGVALVFVLAHMVHLALALRWLDKNR